MARTRLNLKEDGGGVLKQGNGVEQVALASLQNINSALVGFRGTDGIQNLRGFGWPSQFPRCPSKMEFNN